MKLFFISDIHGSLYYLKKALKKFDDSNADRLIILGDELYHGPRNPLPKEYNPQEVLKLLNSYKDKIIAVRGNCDSEVDQMVLEYPIMSDYSIFNEKGVSLFLTHGHIYNSDNRPKLTSGDALIFGHFHIPEAKLDKEIYILNPGSISLPKGGYENSYAILDDLHWKVLDFSDNILKEIKLKGRD